MPEDSVDHGRLLDERDQAQATAGRLAVLVPWPRINLILYRGVLAPRAAWRPAVVRRQTLGVGRDASTSRGRVYLTSSSGR
jgi:hypothetical protein